ncbi:hypothetical protein KGMB02408_06880 [Bacteroides faecalis]|uniref:Uncharacterized protein n=1 Tax=Bacteroides faecalis TaxID=2447885 RepID=A0A401LQJ2_9BACE|nr:hypothetical protein KGMB02408_06880 [Bacteroides faecalis]
MDDEMIPFPNEEATPPVTKIYFVSPTAITVLIIVYLVVFYELKNRKIIKKRGSMLFFVPTNLLKNAILKESYDF